MLACAALMAILVGPAREASAAPQDIANLRLATWNMQGATNGRDSKWTAGVTQLVRGSTDRAVLPSNIVALQEAGSSPPPTVQNGVPEVRARSGNLTVTESLWQPGSTDEYRYVYFMETDPTGHRVNLAMVTDRVAEEVVIIPPGLSNGESRESFGVRFGTTWFFTLHALSGSGNDGPGLLRNIAAAAGGNSWVALGDFNRDPVRLYRDMPLDGNGNRIGVVTNTGQATYQGSSELDYMVTSGDLVGVLAPNRLRNPGGSDHTPVQFGSALAASATAFQITATDVPPGIGATVQAPSMEHEATLDDDLRGAQNWHFQNYSSEDKTAQIANSDPDIGCMAFWEDGTMRTTPCVTERDQVPPEQKMTIVDADVPGEGRDVEIRPFSQPDYCLYASYQWQQPSGFSGRSTWRNCRAFQSRAAAEAGGGSHWTLTPVRRVMIVGDSITQGREGDFTWRYRLWQWLRSQKVAVDFVGPYSGTFTPDKPAPPSRPLLPGETPPDQGPRTTGGYAVDIREPQSPASGRPTDIRFDSDHYAHWGRQAAQVKRDIRQQVATYRPDLILLAVGFNDMGWFVSDEHGTLDSVGQIIAQAREANPSVDFALANVPQRTKIGGRDDLIAKTDHYNSLLPQSMATWHADDSPISNISLVDWAGRYACSPTNCPSGYDGLHPNEHGEYELAVAFAEVLRKDFGFGASAMDAPATVPARLTPAFPTNVRAASTPLGVTVTWDPVYGAVDYDVRSRIAGQTAWSQGKAFSNRTDTTWTVDGIGWEYQVRANMGCRWPTDPREPHGCTQTTSGWSGTVSATAHPQTAPPPTDIASRPSATGVDVAWTPPTGPHTDTIDRYEIILYDKDTPGAFLTSTGARGTVAHIDGLIPGHRYLVAIATWNAVGGGLPALARPVTVGVGTPSAPTDLEVTSTDATTVQLDWNGSNDAAGYRVWVRNISGGDKDGSISKADEDIVEGTSKGIGFLFPGVWNYEFCVTAVNGVYESGKSNCVVAPRPAGSLRSSSPKAARPSEGDRTRQAVQKLLDLPKPVDRPGPTPGR
ncbi:fibronectin type III domain-containing protein [Streptomyces sp. NPDC005017]|uniref:fibronectin type III domain-containing protein n=1 Tax=Streptomyces sp. NPDC005017 TaxID=3364706 RepID=UPI00368E087F